MNQYGLIGNPLKHSFSQGFFNDKFRAENIEAEYINFEIPAIEDLKSIIKNNPQLKGLNVTIPYKEQVIPFLDHLSENAKLIGAVNVIKIERIKKNKRRIRRFIRQISESKRGVRQFQKADRKRKRRHLFRRRSGRFEIYSPRA